MDQQDKATCFSSINVKALPDKPGLWFYQATGLPVNVIQKEGNLYFKGGQVGEEEMLVSEFAKLKEKDPALTNVGFVLLQPAPLQTPIAPTFSAS